MGKLTRGKIGVYGPKTRALQKRLSGEYFGLSFKDANVYLYLGSRANADPNINDIQTKTFFEVPDRAYASEPVNITIGMEPLGEAPLDFSRFGIINPIGDEQTFRIHVDEFECLGRPMVVGDVMEIPFFQSDDCDKAFWEVSDVDDKPSFEKFYYTIRATVLEDSRKTREIAIDNSNDDLLTDIMNEADTEREEQVPYEGFDETQTPVDYRRDNQASFLDDPNKVFNDEDV